MLADIPGWQNRFLFQSHEGLEVVVRGGLVASGTSCVIVLVGDDLTVADPEWIIRRLFLGNGAVGLGGSHYQSNKVAIIWSGTQNDQFMFRFYQYDKENSELVADMECSNAAAGCAAFAVMIGLAVPWAAGAVRAYNLGTGQYILLRPERPDRSSAGRWQVSFVHDDLYGSGIQQTPKTLSSADNRVVEYWPLAHGNGFLFARSDPHDPEPALIAAIEEYGSRRLLEIGLAEEKANRPKVIFYDITDVAPGQAALDASCFFLGQRHRSLPGSGAMFLSAFLTLTQLLAAGSSDPEGAYSYRLRHASGELVVTVHWVAEAADYRIVTTEFETSVAILMVGSLVAADGAAGLRVT